VGILGHLSVADHVQITAMSLVTRSIKEAGVYSSGTPLQPNREWRRNAVQFRHLDELAKRLRKLEGHNED
jgi:UDP-3-O-[3-hydroxymyristoyl] glucosamine N-acyltransferase